MEVFIVPGEMKKHVPVTVNHAQVFIVIVLVFILPYSLNFRPPLIIGRGWPKIRGAEKSSFFGWPKNKGGEIFPKPLL